MLKTTIFDRAHLDSLKRALDVYSRRHRVVSDNIANVQTQGYRAREYRFEELLAGATDRLRGVRTDPAHLPVGGRTADEVEGRTVRQDSGFDNGVNDVNIDREMSELATNDLSYRLATRLLSMKYSVLRGAITGQMR